jgi:hypothetical protein
MDRTKEEGLTKWCFILAAYPDFEDMTMFLKEECSYCIKYKKGYHCDCCPLDNWICGDSDSLYHNIDIKIIHHEDARGLKKMIEKMIRSIDEA